MSPSAIPPPHPSRCSPLRDDYAAIVSAHEHAVNQGLSTYLDPASGLMVLTVATHLDRGSCCEGGCRHCPFVAD